MFKHPLNQQLALAIRRNDEASLSDFCWGGNILLRQQLQMMIAGNGEHMIYLWGNPGSGKSHLLQGCCQSIHSPRSSIYLPLNNLHEWDPQMLDGIDEQSFIGIDDISAIAANKDWEEALFHLYNRVRDNGQTILMVTGRCPPTQLPILLSDLRSRLSWGLVIHLNELNDEDKIQTLKIRAHNRGFALPIHVGRFLLNRCARNMHDLLHLLDRLDEASLVAQRKITIPFVKYVLGI